VFRLKKSTERKRIKRMDSDCVRLLLAGLISADTAMKIKKMLKAAEKKV